MLPWDLLGPPLNNRIKHGAIFVGFWSAFGALWSAFGALWCTFGDLLAPQATKKRDKGGSGE